MRLLSSEAQSSVLETTCHFLRFHSNFRIDGPSQDGPCGRSVRIITGQEEGLFGWIAVNYLMDGFGRADTDRTTYGFLDMGGASTQIAFEPSVATQGSSDGLFPISLRLLDGEEIQHRVFVTSWLGYGTNQARERYFRQLIKTQQDNTPDPGVLIDPCLPKDLKMTEALLHDAGTSSKLHTLIGSGSFAECLANTEPLLNKAAPCKKTPCLFDGVHVPSIDFSVSHFIGVSEYWYSSEHIFGLGGAYDFVQYERAAQEYCGRGWEDTLRMHHEAKVKAAHREPRKDTAGQIVEMENVVDKVEISRLEMQCFKAAWIVSVLHEGFGMPRIVDPGGNNTIVGNDVAKQADRKGLGQKKPTFQSMDTVGDIAITWTLGKMVLEASSEVPAPSGAHAKPLDDPLQNVPSDALVQPFRPPFSFLDEIDEQLEPHLPTTLSRDVLGFSFITFMFYAVSFLLIFGVVYRLRHQVRNCTRRLTRSSLTTKRRMDLVADSMEEGWGRYPPTPTLSSIPITKRWIRSLSRMGSFWRRRGPPLNMHLTTAPMLRRIPHSPVRSLSTPTRQATTNSAPLFAGPPSLAVNEDSYSPQTPRISSPLTPVFAEYPDGAAALEASSLSLYSRSRNSSTISLSTLTVRQPLSRTVSVSQMQ
jgi:golgi apyrase